MSSVPAIGIDVGGSKIVAGLVDDTGAVLYRCEKRRTPASHESGLVAELTDVIAGLRAIEPHATAVGVGIAGVVRWPDGEIGFAANHGHGGVKLRRNLAQACGLDVVVENDANAAAWAEFRLGPYELTDGLLFVAIGTGLGSGFIADGKLVRGHGGCGAEIGHIVVDRTSSIRCQCGLVGCLESMVSGIALQREGLAARHADPQGSLAERFRRPEDLTTRSMIDAAQAGDPQVSEIVRGMGLRLGRTIGETAMSMFPVDRVVIGGGLAALGDLLLVSVRHGCDKALGRSRCYRSPRVSPARLGTDAVLVGAALRAAEDHPVAQWELLERAVQHASAGAE